MNQAFRWNRNFLSRPAEFSDFWRDLANARERNALLIAGRGFDPRTVKAAEALRDVGLPIGEIQLVRLADRYNTTPNPERTARAERNENRLKELFAESEIRVIDVESRSQDGQVVGGQNVSQAFSELDTSRFTDVIVDIAALPSGIYFPLIGTLLTLWSRDPDPNWNLHCVVCENVALDARILAEGGDRAERVHGFGSHYELVATPDAVKVWAPVLGERQAEPLRKIRDAVAPDETKPVLPFPSRDPRRGDNLVAEYRELLFETWEVDPQGFLYAHEQNPFDVYLQLGRLSRDYVASLEPLGTARTVLSSHTSKLLSLGVLLAAFEHNLPVLHVEPTGYQASELDDFAAHDELFSVWLCGEAYREDSDSEAT